MADGPCVLQARSLTVRYYGRIGGIEDLSLTVDRGETIALVGTNGSGKTSALRALAGFLAQDTGSIMAGDVLLDGRDITGRSPQQVAALGIAMIPERDKVFVELTPREHFRLARVKGGAAFEQMLERVLAMFPDLGPHLDRRAGYLSGGQRQMLAFAAALFRSPRVLLVDEFSQGLAPSVVAVMADVVRALQAEGLTMVVVEQNVALARSMADRLYVLDAGHVVASGTQAELSLSEVTRTYLGLADGEAGA